MNIFFSIPLIFFWSVVLSFVPAVIYLIINPLESIKAEELSSRNIFIIKQESALNKEKRKRNKGVCIIYSICLAITTCFALFNWARSGQAAIIPLFSGIYAKDWIADRNAGVKRAPLSFYFKF
ncbi:MAG: hypothetical protein KAR05_00220 [Candidatus Omnitrophica bacterium]|nr:hypothetical protein [Candidatus Omnitrophota bacterium]